MKAFFDRIKTKLQGLSYRSGLWLLGLCLVSYILSFAQILLPLNSWLKGVLWFFFFGLAKTMQYAGLSIVGMDGLRRLRGYWRVGDVRKHLKFWLRWLGLGLLAMALLLVGLSQYFLNTALHRDTKPYSPKSELLSMQQKHPWTSAWLDSIQHHGALRDTTIITSEGLHLHAWYVAAARPTRRTALLIHGYRSNPMRMLHVGYLYHHDLGWNILLPDLRAHGQSRGEYIGMGWTDRLDAALWVTFCHDFFRTDTLVVHGISMGAATTMCLSGEPTPSYVRAFVADCGYTSVWDEFRLELKKQYGLPAFPLLYVASGLNGVLRGWRFSQASPLCQVARCTRPMLFIHGEADDYVPTTMVYRLFRAKPGKKTLWIAPRSGHANAYTDHAREYTNCVRSFLRGL